MVMIKKGKCYICIYYNFDRIVKGVCSIHILLILLLHVSQKRLITVLAVAFSGFYDFETTPFCGLSLEYQHRKQSH